MFYRQRNRTSLGVRAGKAKKDADTLSRIPLDINQYIPTCTQETSQNVISATLSGAKALQNDDAVYITAVSDSTDALNLDSNLLDSRNYLAVSHSDSSETRPKYWQSPCIQTQWTQTSNP